MMYTAGMIVVGKEAIMPPVAPPNLSIRHANRIAITNATPDDTNNFNQFIFDFLCIHTKGVSLQLIDRGFKLLITCMNGSEVLQHAIKELNVLKTKQNNRSYPSKTTSTGDRISSSASPDSSSATIYHANGTYSVVAKG